MADNKQDFYEITYDIETVHSVFTNTFIDKDSITLMFFGDDHYNRLDDETLLKPVRDYVARNQLQLEKAGISLDPKIEILRYYPNSWRDAERLGQEMKRIIYCHPLSNMPMSIGEVSYCGWNSYRYDLTLMCMIASVFLHIGALENAHPSLIKCLSDCIIGFNGPDWLFSKEVQEMLEANPQALDNWVSRWSEKEYKQNFNLAMWCERHIDWARLGKIAEEGNENAYPPSLKKEMARYGFNIVMDDQVSLGSTDMLTDEQIYDLIYYNVNDVCGTRLIGQNQLIQSGLTTRDTIRRLFPYTSPKNTPFNKLDVWSPSERDCTAARLAGEVLIGPQRKRPVDYGSVSYYFPLADGKFVDILEYMKEHEPYMHPYMYTFFNHFRGKNTTTSWQDWQVKKAQPITRKATANIPYYRDGRPVNSYITISSGGAHGSVMAGLAEYTPEEVNEWIKANVGAVGKEKSTLDLEYIVHVDWSSFYPTLASKMQLYVGSDGIDRFTGVVRHRIELKEKIPHDRASWTHENYVANEDQMGLKFILNNATGAGNMHQKYALLPVDNKTLSMRLIGNMQIWCLAQRMTQAGGFVFSTNTDGIYVYGLTMDEAQQVVDDYISVYGLGVDPEFIPRMINRDTSNRIEYADDEITINSCGGRLRHGRKLHYLDESIGRNIPYPLAVGHAVIDYMTEDKEWLTKPFDRERLKNNLIKIMEMEDSITPWYHIYVASDKRQLLVNNVPQQRINRIILTNAGDELKTSNLKKATKADMYTLYSWSQRKDRSIEELSKELGVKLDYTDDSKFRLHAEIDDGTEEGSFEIIEDRDFTFEEFNEIWKDHGKLILMDEENEEVKCWYLGGLTGYPESEGKIINTAEEVNDIHPIDADLNIEAYTDWAESLLQSWKVTGDIPEAGMISVDDNLGFKVKVSQTKANKIDNVSKDIESLYDGLKEYLGVELIEEFV